MNGWRAAAVYAKKRVRGWGYHKSNGKTSD
jgi:hypothetical protein